MNPLGGANGSLLHASPAVVVVVCYCFFGCIAFFFESMPSAMLPEVFHHCVASAINVVKLASCTAGSC
jgi:hypothetical protein